MKKNATNKKNPQQNLKKETKSVTHPKFDVGLSFTGLCLLSRFS